MVKLTIDGVVVEVNEGTTIMDAAKIAGNPVPSLCFWKGLNEIGACRVCVVEVEGCDTLVTACNTQVKEGMVIRTKSPKVLKARKTTLRLIMSQHNCRCAYCVRSGNCALQKLAQDANLIEVPYQDDYYFEKWDETSPLFKDQSKCIKCMRCVQVCDKIQGLSIWDVVNTGSRVGVNVSLNRKIREADCSFCGQCITHCPVGALRERDDTDKVLDWIADPETITVVQVAPAVRVAWAEEFGLEPGFITNGKMVSALKQMGFDYVFDTNFSADLTIMEESQEFIERFTHKDEYKWPMFTSCCPGWVRFVKSNFPDFVDNLSSAKSPQEMFGAIAKSYFAEKINADPSKMRVISIMPCVAKKEECSYETMKADCGEQEVDCSITTREFVRMIKSFNIQVNELKDEPFDSPLGSGTGAAVIFGATGGVMDAALRTAYHTITGQNPDADAFTPIRGMNVKEWKEAVFNVPGAGDVRIAVTSGLMNTRKLLEAIRDKKVEYDFVEIMACPGGCAGGGGQPIHEQVEMAEYRGNALWDQDKNLEIRYSHENPDIIDLYNDYLEKPCSHLAHHLLHTDHHGWTMPMAPKRKK